MFPPNLAVIECDNPDDQFSQSGSRSHLQLVLPAQPVTNVVIRRPIAIAAIESLIAILVNWQHSLEMYRVWLQRRMAPPPSTSETGQPMYGGRGW